jgi:trehalose 6-phosphate phosphatase
VVSAAELLEPLRTSPSTSALLIDFDGTLAPIVDDPSEAAPEDGATELLSELGHRFGAVVIVSGRPVDFLASRLPVELSLAGLYGLEGRDQGVDWELPNSGAWREIIADVALKVGQVGPECMRVEPKGLSLTLHYRGHAEIEAEVVALAQAQADRSGLVMRSARMSVELHPPIDSDKGTVVERYAGEATAALFAGDDLGDLTGFDALDGLSKLGVHAVRVAVASDESPSELIERADIVVGSPRELVELLRSLR